MNVNLTKSTYIIIAAALALFLMPQTVTAYAPAKAIIATPVNKDADDTDDEEEEVVEVLEVDADTDSIDASTRQGSVLLVDDDIDNDIDIPVPAFINTSKNHITLNGADWGTLRRKAASYKIAPLSIVNIGDSHIQANYGTGVTRELLQYRYGNAGRGLIAPLKMSGTNQPSDYVFSSDKPYSAVKLMKAPWKRTMGFTGTSISPSTTTSNITIGTRSDDDYDPFSSLTIFHRGQMKVTRVTDERGRDILFSQRASRDFTYIKLHTPETRVTIYYDNLGDLTIFGASLSGDRPGVFYHSIGNNGATFDTYNRIGDIGISIKALSPDLVILSLGTNEAFGRLDPVRFKESIDNLVKDIKSSNPATQVLLVTPMECHRSTTKTVTRKVKVRGNKGKGKKRAASTRTVREKVRTSGVNANIKPLRDAMLEYARDNHIAVYDLYDIAGGPGSSNKWIEEGLFSPDKIHHSVKGYKVEGRLLYDALIEALSK